MDASRANNFDGLRLLGAAAVMVSHQFAIMGAAEPMLLGLTLGRWGVFVFFGISGYLIAKSWQSDPSITRFTARRCLRIFPALIALHVATVGALWAMGLSDFSMNPISEVNGSLWSIEVELMCYALFAALALLTRVPALAMVAAILAAWQFQMFQELPIWRTFKWAYMLSTFGVAFGVGGLLAYYPAMRSGYGAALLAAVGLLMWHEGMGRVWLGSGIGVAAVAIGLKSWPVLRHSGRWGDVSYGLYLYAFPVQQLIVMWLGPGVGYLTALSLSAVITLGLAFLSWRLVEQPALSLKPRSRLPSSQLVGKGAVGTVYEVPEYRARPFVIRCATYSTALLAPPPE